MAVPHPTRVCGGPRSRPVCLAPAPALAGGARDASHHRVSPAGGTRGRSVDPGRQRVTVDGRAVRAGPIAWLALNKPVGYVVSRRDPEGRRTVYDLLPEVPGLTYVGRLDVMTSGLLLLTTDGAAAHRLMHPRFAVPRTYWLRAHGRPAAEIAAALGGPIAIDGQIGRPTSELQSQSN